MKGVLLGGTYEGGTYGGTFRATFEGMWQVLMKHTQ